MTRTPVLTRSAYAAGLVTGLLLLAVATCGQATVLSTCEQARTLTGGHWTLAADLDCGTYLSGTCLTLDGASLDLQGHTFRCGSYVGPEVMVTGWGSRLGNGTIGGGGLEGIRVSGLGGHYLYDLADEGSERTIIVDSHWNLLVRVEAHGGAFWALRLSGMANWIASSTFTCPESAGACIFVDGHYNAVTWNLVTRADGIDFYPAILVSGDRNWLARNTVMNVNGDALRVSGQGNVLASNTLQTLITFAHSDVGQLDADDTHGDCTHNTWLDNRGLTQFPACIGLRPLPQNVQR